MNFKSKILIALFALGTILGSCDSLIYDDFKDCPQGVYVKFYSMTPCEVDSTFIGNVSSLTVFAFDENGRLVASVSEKNVVLSKDFEVLVPVSDGNYSFVAWTGIDDKFTTSEFSRGVTTKKDVLLRIRSTNSAATQIANTHIWHGESPVVFLPDPDLYGTVYKHTAVNLKELTNRVKVVVEFEPSVTKSVTPKDLAVAVSSANGTVLIDATMPLNSPILNFAPLNTTYTTNSVTWDFALLNLMTGYHNKLTITYPEAKQNVFDGDLLASILLNPIEGGINLDCENDFTVRFVVKDYCAQCQTETHFICAVYVNDWMVHSYSTELGI